MVFTKTLMGVGLTMGSVLLLSYIFLVRQNFKPCVFCGIKVLLFCVVSIQLTKDEGMFILRPDTLLSFMSEAILNFKCKPHSV